MIFHRALQREFAQSALVLFVALFAILMTTQLIRLLAEAAGGKLDPASVLTLLGFGALNYLAVLLSFTLFGSVLLTLSRSYRDSEMVVWFTSGQPLTAWIGPVLKFSIPMLVGIAVLSLFLSPWALTKSSQLRQRMEQRDDAARVTPGSFNESAGAERVFFVEGAGGEQGRVSNIFISSVQNGRTGVMAAARGHTETAINGDRFLVMEDGRRYEGVPGKAEYREMEFHRYSIRIETAELRGITRSPNNMPVWDLIRNPSPDNLGELVWRIGIPLAAVNLALLAIPLSFVNPRAGRANNFVFAILTFMIYSNLISVSQAWVRQQRVPFEIGIWAVHFLMLAILLLLFWRRLGVVAGTRWWR